ncbi:MAG: TlpA family protein disulfide reductase [Acidobacteriia bacterium]|nr:TlpA family protein disulfide reductase [Terriglobia bacterium]
MKTVTDRILLGLVLVLGVSLAWVVKGTLDDHIVRIGDTAPDFKVVTETGRTVTPANFGGKLLVLNFWASWCQPCLQEVPSLEVFSRQFAPEGVVVLGVSVDKNENLYHQFLRQFPVTFQVARDPSWDIAANYGTFQLPETYIIDSSGKVVQKVIAAQNWMNPEFVQSIKKML